MNRIAPSISQLRRSRIARWAALWLSWFAGFVDAVIGFDALSPEAVRIGHRWLDNLERLIIGLASLRVANRVRRAPRRKGGRTPYRAGLLRAVLGSALRRRLRTRDLRRRVAALRIDIDELASLLLKRLPFGLTRRAPVIAKPEARTQAPAIGHALLLACVDSS